MLMALVLARAVASSSSQVWELPGYHGPLKMVIHWVDPPPSNCGKGSPTKNVIILVVTATGRGDNPSYTCSCVGNPPWI